MTKIQPTMVEVNENDNDLDIAPGKNKVSLNNDSNIKGKKKDEDNHLIPMKTSKYDKFIGISNISTWFTNMWSTVTSSIIPSPISSSDFVSNVDKKRKKKKKHLNSESKDGPKEFIDEEMGGVGAKPISLSPSKNKKDKND